MSLERFNELISRHYRVRCYLRNVEKIEENGGEDKFKRKIIEKCRLKNLTEKMRDRLRKLVATEYDKLGISAGALYESGPEFVKLLQSVTDFPNMMTDLSLETKFRNELQEAVESVKKRTNSLDELRRSFLCEKCTEKKATRFYLDEVKNPRCFCIFCSERAVFKEIGLKRISKANFIVNLVHQS